MNADHTPRPTGGWPDDENKPVFAPKEADVATFWWQRLGLTRSYGRSTGEHPTAQAIDRMLAGLRPGGFVRDTEAGPMHLSFDDVVTELDRVRKSAGQRSCEAARARNERGWSRVRDALSGSEFEPSIEDGPWAGFTRGRAVAWCWNLFDYEPHGFISPGALVRAEALRLLENGGLPTVFGYPARAAELECRGFTPVTYRRAQEALGTPTFSPADVRHG